MERHLGRKHSLTCLVSEKTGVSNQDRCKEVHKFLLSLSARFGLTSLQALIGKLVKSYNLVSVRVSHLRETLLAGAG